MLERKTCKGEKERRWKKNITGDEIHQNGFSHLEDAQKPQGDTS